MKLFRNLTIMFALVAVPTIASASPSRQQAASSQQPTAAQMIAKLDKNKNRTLEKREVKGTQLESKFASIDRNRNGRLTKSELTAALDRMDDGRDRDHRSDDRDNRPRVDDDHDRPEVRDHRTDSRRG